MITLEFAHIRDLRTDRQINVRCRRCRHVGSVEVERIRRVYMDLMPVLLLREKLRCTSCGAKGEVDINAAAALAEAGSAR